MSSSSHARTIVPFLPQAARITSQSEVVTFGEGGNLVNHRRRKRLNRQPQPPSHFIDRPFDAGEMDEWQKLLDDLARRLTLRTLTTDARARDAIDESIRDIEDRLAELDEKSESDHRRWC
jgi:hypothetical protein